MSVKMRLVRPTGITSSEWNKVANQALKVTRSVTPVDTGRLKSSLEVTNRTSRSITVTANEKVAPYAPYVNDGTPRMAPRDFTGIAKTILEDKFK
jgi:hypothetical protein